MRGRKNPQTTYKRTLMAETQKDNQTRIKA